MDASSSAILNDPAIIILALMAVVGAIYALEWHALGRRLTSFVPVPVWIFVMPMALSTAGVLPAAHDIYRDMGAVLMPLSLFLLTITIDVRAVMRMGKTAAIMVAAGTLGTSLGAIISFTLFAPWLMPDAWKAFSVLSAAWIGGSANAVAMQQSLQAQPEVLAPILATDTVAGYGWVTLLILLVSQQARLDRWLRAKPEHLEGLREPSVPGPGEQQPMEIGHLAVILGIGAIAAALSLAAGHNLPELGNPTIITHTAWTMLLVVSAGIVLSFTRCRRLESIGASRVGYYSIFLLLASLGAQGDFSAFLEAPLYLAAGLVWLAVHVLVLVSVARVIRAPFFFVATGSTANIGGVVTAPLVAGIYRSHLVSLGLLMALAAQIGGVYIPVAVARVLAGIAG